MKPRTSSVQRRPEPSYDPRRSQNRSSLSKQPVPSSKRTNPTQLDDFLSDYVPAKRPEPIRSSVIQTVKYDKPPVRREPNYSLPGEKAPDPKPSQPVRSFRLANSQLFLVEKPEKVATAKQTLEICAETSFTVDSKREPLQNQPEQKKESLAVGSDVFFPARPETETRHAKREPLKLSTHSEFAISEAAKPSPPMSDIPTETALVQQVRQRAPVKSIAAVSEVSKPVHQESKVARRAAPASEFIESSPPVSEVRKPSAPMSRVSTRTASLFEVSETTASESTASRRIAVGARKAAKRRESPSHVSVDPEDAPGIPIRKRRREKPLDLAADPGFWRTPKLPEPVDSGRDISPESASRRSVKARGARGFNLSDISQKPDEPEADATFVSKPPKFAHSHIGKPRVTFDLPEVPLLTDDQPNFIMFDARENDAPFTEPVDFSKRCRLPRGYLVARSTDLDEDRPSSFRGGIDRESRFSEQVSTGDFLKLESDLRTSEDETLAFRRRRR
jgi:hypothetical protein